MTETDKSEGASSKEAEEGTIEEKDDEPEESTKRYLPDHKKPDAAPTFPEKVCIKRDRNNVLQVWHTMAGIGC
jgi:hypothetical protein